MDSIELKARTQKFALDVIKAVGNFPRSRTGDVLGRQLLRSACSVGANYRSACRAQSYSHFISKISTVEEEADESLYWLELSIMSGISDEDNLRVLQKEANELTAIFTSIRKTSSKNRRDRNDLKSNH